MNDKETEYWETIQRLRNEISFWKKSSELLHDQNKKLREAIEYAIEWSGDTNAWNRLNDALK